MPFKQALTEEQKTLVVARFKAGVSMSDLTHAFGVSQQTISRILNAAGARERTARTPTDDEGVAAACRTGLKREEIAAMFGISKETVTRVARDYKITLQTGKPRERTINHFAFDRITEESAYWIGFLFADGAVMNDGQGQRTVATNLAEIDRGHVEKFRAFLGSDHAIGIAKPGKSTLGGNMATFRVRSERLATALEVRGMVPVKAERVPCSELAESRDFWRGMIDGDGSIGIHGTNGYAIIQLDGQRAVLEPFAVFLNKNFRLNTTVCLHHRAGANNHGGPERKNDLYHVQTTGPVAMRVVSALYENACVSLDRKFQTACEILKHARS